MLFRDAPVEAEVAAVHGRVQREARDAIAGLFALTPHWSVTPALSQHRAAELLAEITKASLNALATWWWDNPRVGRGDLVDLAIDALWTGMERLQRSAEGTSKRS